MPSTPKILSPAAVAQQIVSELEGTVAVNTYFKIFMAVGLVLAAGVIGKALVTGSVLLRGAAEPIRRQQRPREYCQTMAIILAVFAVIVAGFVWTVFT